MVLFYLISRKVKKVEGQEFTLRVQKNGQDSVKITDEAALPILYRNIDLRLDGLSYANASHLRP